MNKFLKLADFAAGYKTTVSGFVLALTQVMQLLIPELDPQITVDSFMALYVASLELVSTIGVFYGILMKLIRKEDV